VLDSSHCSHDRHLEKAVTRLLVDIGQVCEEYQDRVLRNLPSKRLQLDELWGFIACKQRNVTPEIAAKNPYAGDVWLWSAIDADSKLIVSWRLGPRNLATAYDFTHDLAARVSQRVQITTDGLKVYLEPASAFYEDVDYAVLQKVYGHELESERRYSPAKIVSSQMEVIKGTPNPRHISTSYIERLNWSTRTSMRRYTRPSNGFSRKFENHEAAVALNYFVYNFIRIHRTLRVTPSMAAGVTARLWEVADLVALLVEAEADKKAA
jgi:IS1 family transposase